MNIKSKSSGKIKEKMSTLCKRNITKISIKSHLSRNSFRNKFDSLISQMTGTIDIIVISETKLDDIFPVGKFIIEGYGVPYRVNRNANGEGIMLFIRQDVTSKLLQQRVFS